MEIAIFVLIVIVGALFNQLNKVNKIRSESEKKLSTLSEELKKYEPIKDINAELDKIKIKKRDYENDILELSNRLKEYKFKTDLEEMGFYKPKFFFADVLQ